MAYLPLSTANLPDPAIDPAQGSSPDDYFGIVTTTISSSTGSISGYNFQPDWVWRKRRDASQNHGLYDAVRGGDKELVSNSTSAENTNANLITAFNSDGFDYGGSMFSLAPYVIWAWKANGSGVSNTDGSITSTVSANTESGFSIVSYTGNATTNATVGHGLTNTPELIIHKNRDVVDDWSTWCTTIGTGYKLYLNTTAAKMSTSNYPTLPTDSVFYLGAGVEINGSGNDMIAYCFHSVDGFSKFGSYTGNGSADGPFVYTGFRPAFLMVKRTDSTANWQIYDTARDSFNFAGLSLAPNGTAAESDGGEDLDILSNGFKARDTAGARNANGGTYIYMAFAENPFKYSNAR